MACPAFIQNTSTSTSPSVALHNQRLCSGKILRASLENQLAITTKGRVVRALRGTATVPTIPPCSCLEPLGVGAVPVQKIEVRPIIGLTPAKVTSRKEYTDILCSRVRTQNL